MPLPNKNSIILWAFCQSGLNCLKEGMDWHVSSHRQLTGDLKQGNQVFVDISCPWLSIVRHLTSTGCPGGYRHILAPSRNVPCDSGCAEKFKAVSSEFCPFMVPFSAQEAASHRSFSPEALLPGNTVKSASIGFPGKQASTLVNPRSSHSFSLRRETYFVHLFLASP